MAETRRRRWGHAAAILVVPLLAFLVLTTLRIPVCYSRVFFGVPCPACGLTRATEALLHFHPYESLRYHPLAVPVLAYLGVELTRAVLRELEVAPVRLLEVLAGMQVRLGLGVGLLVVYVVRMGGGFGGHPDAFAPTDGWLVRGTLFVADLVHRVVVGGGT